MTDLEGRSAPDAYGVDTGQCSPEWEPDAVYRAGMLFHWRCACGDGSWAPYMGRENARTDFVSHVLNRRTGAPRSGPEA